MNLLHAYFNLRHQQAFQRLLERDYSGPSGTASSGLSASAGKSSPGKSPWNRKSIASELDVNSFDQLGRTVLHLSCSSTEVSSVEYARMLLAHPHVNINLPDKENRWTALHRALYAGNIEAANAALGLNDANDRAFPDYVVLPKKDLQSLPSRERFATIKVREVKMSKLHTAIITNEPRDNLRLCGFGSGGRLGLSSHLIYAPTQIALPAGSMIVSVALGQDHTLAVTSAGEVLSWGLNRFSQLGYVVESGQGGSVHEAIQLTPRKVSHLRRELVRGVAACYSKTTTPVQVYPRQVSVVTQPVHDIAMAETAMVCLFVSGEVVCLWHDGISKVSFPNHSFPSEIFVYRPPQTVRGTAITKIVNCEDAFAALSSNGEVFTFSTQTPPEFDRSGATAGKDKLMKPQRVWALRRQFSSIRDVDIGSDGTLIVCTQSGHVYVRSRNLKGITKSGGNKPFKFQRIAHIQRAVAVCTNSTGAFGALKVDYKPPPIRVVGRSLEADMTEMAPHMRGDMNGRVDASATNAGGVQEEDVEDADISTDVTALARLIKVLRSYSIKGGVPSIPATHGEDIIIRVGEVLEVPSHRLVLAARSKPLNTILTERSTLKDKHTDLAVSFSTPAKLSPSSPIFCHLLVAGITNAVSFLILLHYLYSDDLLAPWDRRIELIFSRDFEELSIVPARVKGELDALARVLELPALAQALQSVVKRVPMSTARERYRQLFHQVRPTSRRDTRVDAIAPDVALHLKDQVVYGHSVILRARCPFFAAFFGDQDWTIHRRDRLGIVDVQMRHLEWKVMQFVMEFMCFGEEQLFDRLDFAENVDDVVEFMLQVLAAANELLLGRLVLLCSQVVLEHLNPYNACYLLSEAIHYHAAELTERIESYIAANLEMFLESRILDDLETRVLRHLAEYTRAMQMNKAPVTRSNKLAEEALEKHRDWLALQDIPTPFVPNSRVAQRMPRPCTTQTVLYSPSSSPSLAPGVRTSVRSLEVGTSGDEVFIMDDTAGIPSLDLDVSQQSGLHVPSSTEPADDPVPVSRQRPVWKTETGRNTASSMSLSGELPKSTGKRTYTKTSIDHVSTPDRVSSDPTVAQAKAPSETRTIRKPLMQQQIPATPPRSTTLALALGPKITPVRQPPVSSMSVDSRKPRAAWTLPPVQPIAQASFQGAAPSFAEIQLSQQIQGVSTVADKRSLLDIQEEERARRQEEDFMRWWAKEEVRVRQELAEQEKLLAQATAGVATAVDSCAGGTTRKGKSKVKKSSRRRP
ncbi:hypothetical protein ID866_8458 [Astraeus odoratus]|nr:hypothetical protein ID866_8458 [Astraeus odoratus]